MQSRTEKDAGTSEVDQIAGGEVGSKGDDDWPRTDNREEVCSLFGFHNVLIHGCDSMVRLVICSVCKGRDVGGVERAQQLQNNYIGYGHFLVASRSRQSSDSIKVQRKGCPLQGNGINHNLNIGSLLKSVGYCRRCG